MARRKAATYIPGMERIRTLAAALSLLAIGVAGASAQSVVSTGESFVSPHLLTGERAAGHREAGLALSLAPGWKTYWRSPGDAGIPPRFDWSGSENLAEVRIAWPRPVVFESFGMQTIGYRDEVVLPLELVPVDPARPIRLALTAEVGVCKDMCVMEVVELGAEIAPDAPADDLGRVADARAKVPGDGRAAGLVGAECAITGAGRERGFDGSVVFDRAAPEATVILEGTDEVWIHSTEARAEGPRLRVAAGVSLAAAETWIDRSALRLTVLAPDFAADIRGCRAPAG